MHVWFTIRSEPRTKCGGVLYRDVDALDIHTKRYIIRIRMGGMVVIRKKNEKVGRMENEIRLEKSYNLL